jgi:4-oxalocrotonate tautomerase
MPTIIVQMFEGRTDEQKRKLVKLVTQSAVEALGVRPEGVHVRITELEERHSAVGGVLRTDAPDTIA